MMETLQSGLGSYMEKVKKIKADKLLIILLAGILLLVICLPVKSSGSSSDLQTTKQYADGSYDTGANESQQADIGLNAETSIEAQLEELLQKVDGVGQVKVMITANSEYNQIEGVVVVAEGADIPQVRQEIIETAQALFPIAAYKVKVCKMAGGQT